MPQQGAPKKKVNKKVLIPVIAGAVVLAAVIVVLCVVLSRCGKTKGGSNGIASAQRQALVINSYGKFMGRYNIGEVREKETDADSVRIDSYLDSQNLGQDGNVFYGIDGSKTDQWVKITIKGKYLSTSETWIDETQLNESVIGVGNAHVRDVSNFTVCGNNVIARVSADPSFFIAHKELNFRIIRASKDGKSISFVGDENVRATELVVSNGWIYYVDNGYYCLDGRMEYDRTRVGIYKIKPDGSGKKRIFDTYDGGTGKYEDYHYGNAGGITISNGWIYFMDLSDSSSCLARIRMDGSGYERLTQEAASGFTIDTQQNKIYYLNRYYSISSADYYSLCELDLASKTVSVLNSEIKTAYLLTYDNGYIYLCSTQKGIDSGGFRRLQVSSGKKQVLKIKRGALTRTEDEDGFISLENTEPDTLRWEDLDIDDRL